MFQRPWLSPHAVCSVLVSVAAIAGCKQVPATLTVVPSARAERGSAVVTADPSALIRSLNTRRVLGMGFREAGITQLRLSAKTPGGTAVTGPSIAYTPANPAAMPTTPLTMTVSAGPNRMFMLEGLDAGGRTLAAICTAATLTDGANFALTFNGVTHIVAEVMDQALSSVGDSPFHTEVAAGDVVASLMTYVQASVGLNTATNQFTGVDPLAYDRPYLATLLTAAGVAGLSPTPPADLSVERWGRLIVSPSQYDGRTPYTGFGLAVDVYDPTSGQVTSATANAAGEFVFPKVPMGDWHVRVQAPGGAPTAWHKVPVKGDTFARLQAVAPPAAPITAVAAGAAPAIVGNTDGSRSLMVWQEGTGTGAEIMGQLFDGNRATVGLPFSISQRAGLADVDPVVAYNPAQDEYVVAWGDGASLVYATEVSAGGAVSASSISVPAGASAEAAIACNSSTGEFLLVCNASGGGVQATKLTQNGAGNLASTMLGAFSTGSSAHSPAVAFNRAAGEYLIAYADLNAGTKDLFVQSINGTSGSLVRGQTLIAGGVGDQIAPAVGSRAAGAALPNVDFYGNEFLVAWQDHWNGNPEIRACRVPAGTGTPSGPQLVANGNNNFRPRIDFMPSIDSDPVATGYQYAANADHYMIAWEHIQGGVSDIHARRVNTGLNMPLDDRGEVILAKDAMTDTRPAVWADPAHFDYVVVWQGGSTVRQSIVR